MRDLYVLYLAFRDRRVSWPPKLLVALAVAYAFLPLDLSPDWIPFFGYIDDVVIVPLGISIAMRFIPAAILAEHRAIADGRLKIIRRWSWAGGAIVAGLLLIALAWLASFAIHNFRH
jgi:uncharacterized membrane protein YkvA (DUF1232 family)